MTPIETALAYAAGRGWPIFPVSWDGKKHPLIKAFPTDATTDPAVIATWWRRWPNAWVAVVCGRRSGFVVLDVDVKNGCNGFDTLADLGCSYLPVTPISHTRSWGVHVYLAVISVEIRNSIGKFGLGPGLDVRGQGGFVV